MKKKPGVMLYFDLRGMLQLLTDAEKGMLFDAILEYAETGKLVPLSEKLKVAWPLVQMRLDMDTQRYQQTVVKRKYAAYTRWAKEHAEPVKDYPQWAQEHGYEATEYEMPLSV